jgi:hypothetical protein
VGQGRENIENYRPHQENVAAAVEAAIQIALGALRAEAHES